MIKLIFETSEVEKKPVKEPIYQQLNRFIMEYLQKSGALEVNLDSEEKLKFVRIDKVHLAKVLAYDYGMCWSDTLPDGGFVLLPKQHRSHKR